MRKGLLLIYCFVFSSLAAQNDEGIYVVYECRNTVDAVYDTYLSIDRIKGVSKFTNNFPGKTVDLNPGTLTLAKRDDECYHFLEDKKSAQKSIAPDSEIKVFAEWIEKDEWKITQEEKEVLGYRVIKAVKKYPYQDITTEDFGDYVAWFAPDIPLGSGPDVFSGLPGLILILTREHADYADCYFAKEIKFGKAPDITYKREGIRVYKDDIGQAAAVLTDDYLKLREDEMVKEDKNYKRQVKDAWWKFW